VWLEATQLVQFGFESVFQFQVSEMSSSGADGIAFVILGRDTPQLGGAGASLGYGSVANSLAVEFDMYQNSQAVDLDNNHIGVHSRGTAVNSGDETASLGRVTPVTDMSDQSVHTALVRYKVGLLQVYLDELQNPLLEVPVDLGALLSLNNGAAWVGLTAATGGQYEIHDILMWSFRPNMPPQVQLNPLGAGPYFAPTNLVLAASVSDPDGEPAEARFFANGKQIGAVPHPPFLFFWQPAAGTYSLTAQVTDEFGATGSSFPLTVPVYAVTQVANVLRGSNGSIAIQFSTTAGQTYTVQYSTNLVDWQNSLPTLSGTGNPIQWNDSGPPVTPSSPTNQNYRFYRVLVSP
jgi:hypothetical protein